ncbi:MAG TPA: GFA family protein [Pseudolabrys sp.]|nr:GFA family protein [Pseudolabrys sp.]
MHVDGRCHCGYVTFKGEVDPEEVSICHCTDCQDISGSAFRVNVPVAAENFRIIAGEPAIYVKHSAESGKPRENAFCPRCGSALYAAPHGPETGILMLRVGALRQRDQLQPRAQNWVRSAQSWMRDRLPIPKNEKI